VSEHGPRSVFRAQIVPELWLLGNTMHSRIFTDRSVPDVLRAVLAENGISASFDLTRSYPTEEHVCQYRESDLDFVSRWMEREGMYYYFEQGEGREQLVVTDDNATAIALLPRPVRFYAQAGRDATVGGSIRSLTCEHTALPAGVRLRDYDYAKPALDLSGAAAVAQGGRGQISRYGERFFSAGDGQRLAEVRAQALRARQVVFHATGSATHLRPGYLFEIEDHPRPAFNAEYLATSVEHHLNQAAGTPEIQDLLGGVADEVYRVTARAIPASVQFRSEERTPWPRIYGFENAVVDGPAASEYAQIDDQGRYAVKLHFDESALRDGKASTRVRMLQPHGGSPEGFHFPLRKGTEVVCTFLGGDPDRPVIAGVVHNAVTPSAVTAANHTTNVIQTGGRNRFELEDRAGSQRVTLSTPTQSTFLAMGAPVAGHHFTLQTDAHGYVQTGQNFGVEVKERMSTHVVSDTEERYDQDHRSWVKGDQQQWIKGDRSVEVKGDQGTSIFGDHNFDLKGDENLTIKGNQSHTITGDHTSTFLADRTLTVQGDHSQSITGASLFSVGGNHNVTFLADVTTDTSGDNNSSTGGDSNTTVQGSTETVTYGNCVNIAWGSNDQITGGANTTTTLGANTNLTLGADASVLLGLVLEVVFAAKVSITIGPEAEERTLTIKDHALKFEHVAGPHILAKGVEIAQKGLNVAWQGFLLYGQSMAMFM
jgi:type VI secretion system secreted protein VgrG